MAMRTCILCGTPLHSGTKPEHIWLKSCGGRMQSSGIYCDRHNSEQGSGPDKALAESVAFIRNLMNFPDGKGRPPPTLHGRRVGDLPIVLLPGAIPVAQGGRPFTITQLPDGRQNIQLRVNAENAEAELARIIPDLTKALRVSEEEVRRMLAAGHVVRIEQRIGGEGEKLQFGGPEAMRSMLKTCLSLWTVRHGCDELCRPIYADAKQFVLTGNLKLVPRVTALAPETFSVPVDLADTYGPHFNLACVASNAAGRVVGYFRLYNLCAWRFVLCEAGGAPNAVSGLILDPSNPKQWNKFREDGPITYEMLARSSQPADHFEDVRAAMTGMLGSYYSSAREREVGRIVERAIADHNLKEGDLLTREFIGDLAERVTCLLMQVPYCRRIDASTFAAQRTD